MSNEPKTPRRLVEGGENAPEASAMRRLLADLPPREDLGPATHRVWRRLEEGRQPRHRGRLVFAAALACAASGLVLFLASRPERVSVGPVAAKVATGSPPQAAPAVRSSGWRLRQASGRVVATAFSQKEGPGRAGDALPFAMRLATGSESRALLQLGHAAAVLVGPGTELSPDETAGIRLVLKEGELLAKVAPRPPDAAFVVRTARFDVRVVGTLFSVREQAGRTRVDVAEGTVEVSGLGRTVRVKAHQHWDSDAPERVEELDAVDPAHQALLLSALASDDEVSGPAGEPAPLVPTPRPSAAKALPKVPFEPSRAPTQKLEPAAKTPEPTGYERGIALLHAGSEAMAEAAFDEVVQQSGVHRDLALYELGQLRQRRADTASALASYELYRRDYPNGSLAQEVELSLIETLLSAREKQRATVEITRFLIDHPDSERAAELHLARGNLARERSDCGDALADYRAVPAWAPQADDALFFTAWCQRRLGGVDEARATLTTYRSRFPSGRHAGEVAGALEAP